MCLPLICLSVCLTPAVSIVVRQSELELQLEPPRQKSFSNKNMSKSLQDCKLIYFFFFLFFFSLVFLQILVITLWDFFFTSSAAISRPIKPVECKLLAHYVALAADLGVLTMMELMVALFKTACKQ